MAGQNGKKKPAKTHVRQGQTGGNYIDSLADQAAGIRQVNPDSESRWTPEEDKTMTRDIGGHLEQDFGIPGTKRQQQAPPPRSQRPAQKPQAPAKPSTRPPPKKTAQPPPKPKPKPSQPPSKEILAKAKIISEKYKRGELSKDQYRSMRKKLSAQLNHEAKAVLKKISALENKFLNNQVSMEKYNAMFDSLNKELNRLKDLKRKIDPN